MGILRGSFHDLGATVVFGPARGHFFQLVHGFLAPGVFDSGELAWAGGRDTIWHCSPRTPRSSPGRVLLAHSFGQHPALGSRLPEHREYGVWAPSKRDSLLLVQWFVLC